MAPTLVFISPLWCPELEELIQITRHSFQIKVLTQKQNIDFEDPFIEILQCFESFSPIEMAKLLPWMLQLHSPRFHLLLPSTTTAKQLAGVGTIVSMARALPQSTLTHSPWTIKSWAFSLWLKGFQSLFDRSISNHHTRSLSLSHPASANKEGMKEYFNDLTHNESYQHVEVFSRLWIFSHENPLDMDWQPLAHLLISQPHNKIEIWNWHNLKRRQQNKWRQQFSLVWDQFQFHTPRFHFSEWSHVQFLVLIGENFSLSERDLLDLVLIHRVTIIMDEAARHQLQGPWIDEDTFWLWHPSLAHHTEKPWSNSQASLHFKHLEELERYRDQISNEIIRSLSQ